MRAVQDRGPIYKETDPKRFPVDAWSTYTNLFFLATFLYWTIKILPEWYNHFFIAFAMLFLFIGWFGGTMYHATRKSNLWLALDIGPIIILCIAATIYFWVRVKAPWWAAVLTLIVPLIAILTTKVHSTHKGAFIGYSVIALPILIPIAFILHQNNYANWHLITGALLSFLIAIGFRTIDHQNNLKRGTHWLWHTFGAVAVFLAINYIYLI